MTRLLELLYILNIKRNIFWSVLHIPALWYFGSSVTYPPWLRRVKLVVIPPCFCIAAIFVKYCYTIGCYNSWANLRCSGMLSARGKIIVKQVYSNWSYSPERPNLGQIWRFLAPCDLEIWRMTFKNNRAPLLSIIKLYVSFHHHMWIQTGVTVRKRLSWVVTSVTLTFDLDLLHGPYPGP